MRLVPRQLQIRGLTGDVPYFGGRFTPAQAYAASKPPPGAPATAPAAGAPPGLAQVGGPAGVMPPRGAPQTQSHDRGPIPGIPSAVPQAAQLSMPSTLQPTQSPSVLAPATATPLPPTAATAGTSGSSGGATSQPLAGASRRPESQRAIQQLLLAGVLTADEAGQLAGRLTS